MCLDSLPDGGNSDSWIRIPPHDFHRNNVASCQTEISSLFLLLYVHHITVLHPVSCFHAGYVRMITCSS